jgi:transcription elongation factor Elf1
METRKRLKLQEIENASMHFKTCPKCNSVEGFWLGMKRDRAYVQCKECGAGFDLFEVYSVGEKNKPSERFRLFKK